MLSLFICTEGEIRSEMCECDVDLFDYYFVKMNASIRTLHPFYLHSYNWQTK